MATNERTAETATRDAGGRVFRVGEVARAVRTLLEGTFGRIWVEGEVSNVRQPSSGHLYFTLKDEAAQLGAVLFRGNRRRVPFTPRDGQQVRAYGLISSYEKGSSYQLIVERMDEAGRGALHAAFEALKRKLDAEGLFATERKRPLPLLPQHVGVVTSPTGAAIRDILKVLLRRFPNVHVLLAPARVQGEGAAEEIAAALDALNEYGGLDVVIVGRGGGSLEDLWCFNEETVARAIARSAIPVIAAVGHEIDVTISDFVADASAPTPSAAAEMVVGRKDSFLERIAVLARALAGALQRRVTDASHRVAAAAGSYVFREPAHAAGRHGQRLEYARRRLEREPAARLREARLRLDEAQASLPRALVAHVVGTARDVERLRVQLRALNPLAVLDRGYSVTRDDAGRVVRRASEVAVGARLRTTLAHGVVDSEVRGVQDEG